MQAGKLRHRIDIERATMVDNAVGEEVPDWTTWTSRWASVETLSGREILQGQQPVGEATHHVRLRYVSGLLLTDRIAYGTKTLEIVHIDNVEGRNREHELLCKEMKAE